MWYFEDFRKINEPKYYPKSCGRESHQSTALLSSHNILHHLYVIHFPLEFPSGVYFLQFISFHGNI